MSDYVLELRDVVKIFGGVTALGGVHFQLKRYNGHVAGEYDVKEATQEILLNAAIK